MKYTKLSLATILTLGSFSAVNAGSLEDAIKGASFNGSFRYRMEDSNYDPSLQKYRLRLSFTTAVSNGFKGVVRLHTEPNATNKEEADAKKDPVTMDRAYLSYVGMRNLTVNIGRNALTFASADLAGNGLTAAYKMGGLTFNGIFYSNLSYGSPSVEIKRDPDPKSKAQSHSLDDGNLVGLGLDGNFGMFSAQAWYLQQSGIDSLDKIYRIKGDKKEREYVKRPKPTYMFGELGLDMGMISANMQMANSKIGKIFASDEKEIKGSTTTGKVVAKMGINELSFVYFKNSKDGYGGFSPEVRDTKMNLLGQKVDLLAPNATFMGIRYDVSVAGIDLAAEYVTASVKFVDKKDDKLTDDEKVLDKAEMVLRASRNISKALKVGVILSHLSKKKHQTYKAPKDGSQDKSKAQTFGRLQVDYSF